MQRFFGTTTAAAMKRVRAALGDDAMVVANRATEYGVEILALPDGEEDAWNEATSASRENAPPSAPAAWSPPLPRALRGPLRDTLWQRLRSAGFSRSLAESLLSALPARPADTWLADELASRLRVAVPGTLLDTRALVLIGPSGVGKTTMVARLAATHAEAGQAADVALVTTDIYRPGARQQLREHAAHLGVDFYSMDDALDLADFIGELGHKRRIIIDAPGFGQRDPRLAAQMRWLCADQQATPVLLLNAAQHPEALTDTVDRYRQAITAAGASLDDVIVTKRDEAPCISPLLEVLMREQLRVHLVCAGQRIPGDMVAADAPSLVAEALACAGTHRTTREAAPRAHRLLRQTRSMARALTILREHVVGFATLERAWQTLAGSRDQAGATEPATYMSAVTDDVRALLWVRKPAPAWYGLDDAGVPVTGAFHRPGNTKALDLLAEANGRFPGAAHLLPRLPHARLWHWLSEHDCAWASGARAQQTVWCGGRSHALRECRRVAGDAGSISVHWRGRIVQSMLSHVRVAVTMSGGKVSALLEAWFADLRDARSGVSLASRYFLLPAWLPRATAHALVAGHLRAQPLPELAGRAAMRLPGPPETLPPADGGWPAAALAALVCRLEAADNPWAMDLRVYLREFADRSRGPGARSVLEGLINLLATCETLRELGLIDADSRDGVPRS